MWWEIGLALALAAAISGVAVARRGSSRRKRSDSSLPDAALTGLPPPLAITPPDGERRADRQSDICSETQAKATEIATASAPAQIVESPATEFLRSQMPYASRTTLPQTPGAVTVAVGATPIEGSQPHAVIAAATREDHAPVDVRDARSEAAPAAVADDIEPQPLHPTAVTAPKYRLAPEKRGGRPRGASDSDGTRRREGHLRTGPRPDVVCFESGVRCELAIELPETWAPHESILVSQDGQKLHEVRDTAKYRLLSSPRSAANCRRSGSDDTDDVLVELPDDGVLVFKLRDRKQRGRRVRIVSSGWYLVVAPDTWQRDESSCGPAPFSPAPVSLPGCRGHFFHAVGRADPRCIAFLDRRGASIWTAPQARQYRMEGTLIDDSDDENGPLVGGNPPEVRLGGCVNGALTAVSSIVLIRQGEGREAWRTSLAPPFLNGCSVDLSPALQDQPSGRYEARLYDEDYVHLESFDFRLASGLRSIQVAAYAPVPGEDGHQAVSVEVEHAPAFEVRPVQSGTGASVVASEQMRTRLSIPAAPDYDRTEWSLVAADGGSVVTAIRLQRVWWALTTEVSQPARWSDRPISVPRRQVRAASEGVLRLRLSGMSEVKQVLVGFQEATAKTFPVAVESGEASIPLRNFCTADELRDADETSRELCLWLEHDGRRYSAIMATIEPSLRKASTDATSIAPENSPVSARGRSARSSASVEIAAGPSRLVVNGETLDEYFRAADQRLLRKLLRPEDIRLALAGANVSVRVARGEPRGTRQAKATAHALAAGLASFRPELRPLLRRSGFRINDA